MNSNTNQTANTETQCCIDHCKTSFNTDGQEVINSYKCNQRSFSNAEMWNIGKKRRHFTVGRTII